MAIRTVVRYADRGRDTVKQLRQTMTEVTRYMPIEATRLVATFPQEVLKCAVPLPLESTCLHFVCYDRSCMVMPMEERLPDENEGGGVVPDLVAAHGWLCACELCIHGGVCMTIADGADHDRLRLSSFTKMLVAELVLGDQEVFIEGGRVVIVAGDTVTVSRVLRKRQRAFCHGIDLKRRKVAGALQPRDQCSEVERLPSGQRWSFNFKDVTIQCVNMQQDPDVLAGAHVLEQIKRQRTGR